MHKCYNRPDAQLPLVWVTGRLLQGTATWTRSSDMPQECGYHVHVIWQYTVWHQQMITGAQYKDYGDRLDTAQICRLSRKTPCRWSRPESACLGIKCMDFGMECHGKFAPSHLDNNLHAGVVRDKHTLKSPVCHLLAHATKVFPLEKALFLNALFATKPWWGQGRFTMSTWRPVQSWRGGTGS